MSVYQEMPMVFVLNRDPHSKSMEITGFFSKRRDLQEVEWIDSKLSEYLQALVNSERKNPTFLSL